MRIVLDTNVHVSGLLNPYGPPGEIVRMVSSGELTLCLDARVLAEYRDVLLRPKFGFDRNAVRALLDYIDFRGQTIAAVPLRQRLPDADDEPFLEIALAGEPECLVTGNGAHYPVVARSGVRVVTPSEFVVLYRARRERETG